jgi:hypothetical protein
LHARFRSGACGGKHRSRAALLRSAPEAIYRSSGARHHGDRHRGLCDIDTQFEHLAVDFGSAPQRVLNTQLILRIRSRTSLPIRGRPPRGRDFHRQYAAKPIRCQRTTVSDPDDDVKNARTATIEPNEQGAVGPTQMQSAWCTLLQDIEPMPQYQDFGFHVTMPFRPRRI